MRKKILELLINSDRYISGEDLSKLLGVSRTAIWKNIKKLKEEGYTIKSITNKGYKLINSPDNLYKDELSLHLNSEYHIFTYDTIDSTNNEAKRKALDNTINKGLFIAEEQTEGKGRRGKQWESNKGSGIWMSLLIRPPILPINASMLTIVTGLAVIKGIKKHINIDVSIKWPNDIVINGKKICGILTEMSSEIEYINYVIIGIGINVNTEDFPKEIKKIATSMKIEGKKKYSRKEILVDIINEFHILYEEFIKNKDLEFLRNEYNKNCINMGAEITVEKEGNIIRGKGLGINNKGELILQTKDNDIMTISSGEASVRGIYGYV